MSHLMTAEEIGARLKLKAKTILANWSKLGLPKPIALGDGPRAPKRWLSSDFDGYLEARKDKRAIPAPPKEQRKGAARVVSLSSRRRVLVRRKPGQKTA